MDSNTFTRIIFFIIFPFFLFSDKWEEAKKAYSYGEFQKAFSIYLNIAEESENFQEKAQGYLYAAWCKYTMGEREEMKIYLQKAVDTWPEIPIEEGIFNEEFNDHFRMIKEERVPRISPEEKDLISSKINELNLLFQNRKFKECLVSGKQLSSTLKFKQIYKILGDCALSLNNIEGAMEYYSLAVKLPTFVKEEAILTPEAQLKKARSLYRRGEKKQALNILNTLIYSYNPPAESFGLAGLILIEQKLYFEAEKVLSQGILLNSGNAQYYNLLGVALYEQGKYGEAIKLFQQASLIDKLFAPALANLAVSYLQYKEYSAAETYFSEALKIDPTNPFILKEYGKTLLFLGKYKEAISKFNEATRYQKELNDLLFLRGIAFLLDKNYEKASKDLDDYLSKNENDINAFEYYGILLKEQEQCKKALDYLKKGRSQVSKRALAQCLIEEGRPSEAIEILENLEEDVPVYMDIILAYINLKDYKKAYEISKKIPPSRRAGKILENLENIEKIYNAYSSFNLP